MGKSKLKVGIAGMTSDHVWGMGGNLAALSKVELVAGAEPNKDRAEEVCGRFGLNRVYDDYLKLFQAEELDAVLVCCDNATKADIVELAAKHQVHVYQDKPMSATLAQADRIVAAAEASGIKVMVAYHPVFFAAYGIVKEWLQEGAIGNLYLARAIIGHAGPKEVNCSNYFCEWLFNRQKNGGGTFVDEGCYSVSTMLDYVGPVSEICSFMSQIGYRDYLPPDVEDNSVIILRFANGALGLIDSKWGQIGPMPFGSSFHGTEGTILTGYDTGIRLFSRKVLPDPLQGWLELPFKREPRPGMGTEAEYFVNCVLENKPIEGPVSPREARATQEVIEAVYRSAETGRAVKLPL
jgi:predicted dehydrogenase